MNKKYAGLDFPAWFDGKDINEAAFCREFLSKNKLIYADNTFFTPDGRLTESLLLKEKIYAELECCAARNIPRTISNIVEIMKLAAHTESFPPKPDEIHVQNGTLRIDGMSDFRLQPWPESLTISTLLEFCSWLSYL